MFIEPKALMFLLGTEMDFVDDRLRSEFVFHNPNSKGECGGCCPIASLRKICVLFAPITNAKNARCLIAVLLWMFAGCGESFNV